MSGAAYFGAKVAGPSAIQLLGDQGDFAQRHPQKRSPLNAKRPAAQMSRTVVKQQISKLPTAQRRASTAVPAARERRSAPLSKEDELLDEHDSILKRVYGLLGNVNDPFGKEGQDEIERLKTSIESMFDSQESHAERRTMALGFIALGDGQANDDDSVLPGDADDDTAQKSKNDAVSIVNEASREKRQAVHGINEVRAKEKELFGSLNRTVSELGRDVKEKEGALKQSQVELFTKEFKIHEAADTIKELRLELANVIAESNHFRSEAEQLQQQLAMPPPVEPISQEEFDKLNAQLEKAKDDAARARTELTKAQENLILRQEELAQKQKAMKTEREELTAKLRESEAALAQLKQVHAADAERFAKELSLLNAKLLTNSEDFAGAQRMIDQLTNDLEVASKEAYEANIKLDEALEAAKAGAESLKLLKKQREQLEELRAQAEQAEANTQKLHEQLASAESRANAARLEAEAATMEAKLATTKQLQAESAQAKAEAAAAQAEAVASHAKGSRTGEGDGDGSRSPSRDAVGGNAAGDAGHAIDYTNGAGIGDRARTGDDVGEVEDADSVLQPSRNDSLIVVGDTEHPDGLHAVGAATSKEERAKRLAAQQKADAKSSIKRLEDRVEELKTDLQERTEQVMALRVELKDARDENERLAASNAALKQNAAQIIAEEQQAEADKKKALLEEKRAKGRASLTGFTRTKSTSALASTKGPAVAEEEVQMSTMEAELRDAETEITTLQFRMKSLALTNKQLENEKLSLTESQTALRTTIKELRAQHASLERFSSDAAGQEAREAAFAEVGEALAKTEAERQSMEAKVLPLETELKQTQERLRMTKEMFQQSETTLQHMRQQYNALQEQNEQIAREKASVVNAANIAADQALGRERELMLQVMQLQDDTASMKRRLSERDAEKNALQTEVTSLENGMEEQLQALLRASEEERLDLQSQVKDLRDQLAVAKEGAKKAKFASLMKVGAAAEKKPRKEDLKAPSNELLAVIELKQSVTELEDAATRDRERIRSLNVRSFLAKAAMAALRTENESQRARIEELKADNMQKSTEVDDMKNAVAEMSEALETNTRAAQKVVNELQESSKAQTRQATERVQRQVYEFEQRARGAEEALQAVQQAAENKISALQRDLKKMAIKLEGAGIAAPDPELPEEYAALRVELTHTEDALLGFLGHLTPPSVTRELQNARMAARDISKGADQVPADVRRVKALFAALKSVNIPRDSHKSICRSTAQSTEEATSPHFGELPASSRNEATSPQEPELAVTLELQESAQPAVQQSTYLQDRHTSGTAALQREAVHSSSPAVAAGGSATALAQQSIESSNLSRSRSRLERGTQSPVNSTATRFVHSPSPAGATEGSTTAAPLHSPESSHLSRPRSQLERDIPSPVNSMPTSSTQGTTAPLPSRKEKSNHSDTTHLPSLGEEQVQLRRSRSISEPMQQHGRPRTSTADAEKPLRLTATPASPSTKGCPTRQSYLCASTSASLPPASPVSRTSSSSVARSPGVGCGGSVPRRLPVDQTFIMQEATRSKGHLSPLRRPQSEPSLPQMGQLAPATLELTSHSKAAAREARAPMTPKQKQQRQHKMRAAWLAHGVGAQQEVPVSHACTCMPLSTSSRPISQPPQSRAQMNVSLVSTSLAGNIARSFWAQEMPAFKLGGPDGTVQLLANDAMSTALRALHSREPSALDDLALILSEMQDTIDSSKHSTLANAIRQVGLQNSSLQQNGPSLAAPSTHDMIELLMVLSSQLTYGAALQTSSQAQPESSVSDTTAAQAGIRLQFRREIAGLRRSLQLRSDGQVEAAMTPRFSQMAQAVIRREELLQRKREHLLTQRARSQADLDRVRKQLKEYTGPQGQVYNALQRMEQQHAEAAQRWEYKRECLKQEQSQLLELAMNAVRRVAEGADGMHKASANSSNTLGDGSADFLQTLKLCQHD